MTKVISIFKRSSEGTPDSKRIEKSIDGSREYMDLWGAGTVQIEKNLEAGTTSIFVHSENGSEKIRLTRTTTWFDKIAKFIPYTEETDDYKVIHLAPADGIYITISKKATEVIINCD